MNESDIILASTHAPAFEEISSFISDPAATLWQDMNTYLQQTWKAAPKIAYSRCSGKPGWNVKYQKSGKSLCTLYPEKESFITLVVISLALVPEVMSREKEFTPYVLGLITGGKPYNGTLWLMIQVLDDRIIQDVKLLLNMKNQSR